MKTLAFIIFFSYICLTTLSFAQTSKITIFQNTNRLIESFKKVRVNDSEKQIYIQFELDYSTSDNYSGTILKYIKPGNNWSRPFNNFLSTGCSVHPPSQICAGVNFFMVAPSDTNFVLAYRLSSWSVDPDARTFLTTNAGINFSQYSEFQCGGAMFYPSGGDINLNNSVWYYSYPNIFMNQIPQIFKSTDQGASWTMISQIANLRTTSPDNSVHLPGGFIKINPFNENYIFIVHRDYMMLSTDGGNIFSSINIPPVKEMVFDFSDNTIYSVKANKIYKSLNNGLSWDSSSVSFVFNTLEISPDNNNVMYAGSPDGVFRTTNRGLSWYLYNNSFTGTRNVIGISKDSNTGDTIIVCTNNEVYKVFKGELVDIDVGQENIKTFRLYQNYPNPFNPVTKIKFDLSKDRNVVLRIYDNLGKEIQTLIDKKLPKGEHEYSWDASGIQSGIYFYKLMTGDFFEVRKMILLK